MSILLAGDIGGTKTILRLVAFSPPVKLQDIDLPLSALYEKTYPSSSFEHLSDMVKAFLRSAERDLDTAVRPQTACFGVAGPVNNNRGELTNLKWVLESDTLETDLGIDKVFLINDFAANGYGILGLDEADLVTLQAAPAQPKAPIAVIGAGTGLGEGFLIPQSGCYHVFPGEGGHADFAPQTELTYQLCEYLQKKEQISHVSVERVVSGIGVISIYRCLRDYVKLAEPSDTVAAAFDRWEQSASGDSPAAEIAKEAALQSNVLSQKTMQLFVQLYGGEAGNLALKLLPYGGLYITGGIAAKILPLMKREGFMAAFLEKGRVSNLLSQVPVYVVTNPKVGLIGAGLYAAKMSD